RTKRAASSSEAIRIPTPFSTGPRSRIAPPISSVSAASPHPPPRLPPGRSPPTVSRMDAYREWTVLPHGPWQELAENLRIVEGTLAGEMSGWPRTMTAIRRGDGTLVLHSAVALDELAMEE